MALNTWLATAYTSGDRPGNTRNIPILRGGQTVSTAIAVLFSFKHHDDVTNSPTNNVNYSVIREIAVSYLTLAKATLRVMSLAYRHTQCLDSSIYFIQAQFHILTRQKPGIRTFFYGQ